jgi:formylglycine-generating enzyme required for sulfatase activity
MHAEPKPVLTTIPAGDFLMGSDDGDDDERPVHRVHVDEFQIGTQLVTNAEYARFVRETGRRAPGVYELPLVVTAGADEREENFRRMSDPYCWKNDQPPRERLDHPVTLVRWDDANAYCAWLSSTAGQVFRLPNEAQWEKAARGGRRGDRYPWGDRFDQSMLNFLSDPAEKAQHGTTPCGMYPVNDYGLSDMAGNVWQWVHDWYAADAYKGAAASAPAPEARRLRVLRGGSWVVSDVRMLRCSYRHKVPPDTYSYAIGFRVASSG